jgi:hypothetical protein
MRGRAAAVIGLAVAAVAALAGPAAAERAITGVVLDDATGAPVENAVVVAGEQQAITDAAGAFAIDDVPFGRIDIMVVADGYTAYFGSARIGAALTVRLAGEAASGEVIEVSGRAPTGPPLHLSTEEIRALPGAGNDALRALQSLPGVARVPFGLGGLALRGTAPRDTNVYLDGIEVPLLYHFGGLASFLPTAAVDQLALSPGGASTRYGRGLGGVAEVTSRTGRGDRWRAGGEVSLIHAAALAEGPGPLRGSWVIGARRSYFDGIVAAADLDLSLVPRYIDAQLRWESGDGRWMAIAFASDDKVKLVRDPNDPDTGGFDTSNVKSFSYTSRFARLGLRYRAVAGATSFTVLPSVGIDDVNARAVHNDIDKGLHRWTLPIALRTELSTPLFAGTLSIGLDGIAQRHAYDMLNTPPATPEDPTPSEPISRSLVRWAADTGAWIEQSWFLARDRIELRPGLRVDYLGLPKTWSADPRIVVHERLPGGIRLEQSVGMYHSPPLVTDLDPIFGDRVMQPSKAIQAAFGATAIVGDDKELSATAYYQRLRQLPVDAVSAATPIADNGGSESGGLLAISRELVDEQFGSYSYRDSIGKGYAYGVELIARRTVGRWTGWLAYTYARSWRDNPTYGPGYRPYVLDQPHTVTAVGSIALGAHWRIGGRFRYATGNPYTPAIGATFDQETQEYVAIDGPLLSERLPAFWQLDLRVDRAWRRSWGTIGLYIDVQNVTNHRSPEGVTYNEDFSMKSYTRGLPVFPSIGVEYVP